MKFTALIEESGERFACESGQSLLRSMECLGRKGIPVGCRGGGCGVCKVRVTAGSYRCERISRACVSVEEQEIGYALACRLFPTTDISVRVVGRMLGAVLGGNGKQKIGLATGNEPASR